MKPSNFPSSLQSELPKLLRVNELVGAAYGTEDFSIFLYSLIKMKKPRNVVELGTGIGVSAFWMAMAMRENGEGEVWTIDNGSHFVEDQTVNELVRPLIREFGLKVPEAENREVYFSTLKALAESFGLSKHLNLLNGDIDLKNAGKGKPGYFEKEVDLLFTDFAHGPIDILQILAAFLPRMAGSSSIFIDSASTKLASYLTLEQTVHQLNQGRIPATLIGLVPSDLADGLRELVAKSRFKLLHMVENKSRAQNSTAWMSIEPVDLTCYPIGLLQG